MRNSPKANPQMRVEIIVFGVILSLAGGGMCMASFPEFKSETLSSKATNLNP
jgi:hypothetical protein